MKKILTTFLLLTFCTVQSTWAGDVIIIGSDGQARYEDESKNTTVSQNVIENTKKKNILNEVTITDDTGRQDLLYIDYKGNVKKIDNSQEHVHKTAPIAVDTAKEAEHQKIIKNIPQTLYNIDSILALYGYGKKDNSSKSSKEYMKMNLLDGDYVIGFKDVPYIAEYHKDGTLMGLAKSDKKVLNENKGSVVFYEYRVGYNTTTGMGLKHVLFLDFEKGKYISQYIYDDNGKLLCRQINNDIFVASEARNMIPDWSKKIDVKVYNQTSKQTTKAMKQQTKSEKSPLDIAGAIIAVPVYLTILPVYGLLALSFCLGLVPIAGIMYITGER